MIANSLQEIAAASSVLDPLQTRIGWPSNDSTADTEAILYVFLILI